MNNTTEYQKLFFGAKLRQMRKVAGFSIDDFATGLRVHGRHIAQVEKGQRPPLSPADISMAIDVLCVGMLDCAREAWRYQIEAAASFSAPAWDMWIQVKTQKSYR